MKIDQLTFKKETVWVPFTFILIIWLVYYLNWSFEIILNKKAQTTPAYETSDYVTSSTIKTERVTACSINRQTKNNPRKINGVNIMKSMDSL